MLQFNKVQNSPVVSKNHRYKPLPQRTSTFDGIKKQNDYQIKIFNCGINILLLASYIRYSMFIKQFIIIYGVKYINLFKINSIRIIVRCVKSILRSIWFNIF